jgi:hypothetical protein
MRAIIPFLAALWFALASPVAAKTSIVVVPPNYAVSKDALLREFAVAITALGAADRMLVYSARPFAQVATIAVPRDPRTANPAWVKRQLAMQFAPVIRFIEGLPGEANGEPVGNLMIPELLDEIGRNIIASLPEKRADVLLIGSLLYFDSRDARWSMTDRFYPSDGLLRLPRAQAPFGVAGARDRLAGMTIHFCGANGAAEQSGQVGTFSYDLATCFRRFGAGETSGQTSYTVSTDAKPEMLRVRAPIPAAVPANMARPGEYFLREDVPISRTPPATSTGIAWIGIKWGAPCDLDLYARPDGASPWLFYGQVRSADGYFNKDYLSAPGDKQFEYIEFNRPIDLNRVEVAVNLYSGDLPTGPEGIIRVWFNGQVYEAPFKLAAKSGSRGALPMSGPYWLRLDLRKIVGLAPS